MSTIMGVTASFLGTFLSGFGLFDGKLEKKYGTPEVYLLVRCLAHL